MPALQNHEAIRKLEYYCLVHRTSGTPILNELKNPSDSSETFDVFFGPYYGDDGIRPQLTELSEKLSEKGGKSFNDRKKLIEYFTEYLGPNTEIRIYDSLRGEIIVEGGNGASESRDKIIKNRFPQIHLDSAKKKTPVLDSYNIAFTDNIESTISTINPAFNRVPHINLNSPIKPVEPSKWHKQYDGRCAKLLDAHGMFGTTFAISRRLAAINAKSTAQTAPTKPEKKQKKWF